MICSWVKDEIDNEYHNNIFGKKVLSDNDMFKAISLEIMQVGLSWHIILKKKKELEKAFFNFDIKKLSKLKEKDINKLLLNKEIIRHKGKIEAIINNAKCIENINFCEYIYSLKPDTKIILKELKKLGFKFIGEMTTKSFLESIGIINGHEKDCIYANKTNIANT